MKYIYGLTKQEFVVWRLVSQGLTNEEIMDRLSIAHTTFQTYLNKLYGKLGLVGAYKKCSSIYRVKALLLWQKAVKEGLLE